MRYILLLVLASSFGFSAQAGDKVKCGLSSYYAFSKCSSKRKKKHLKKLFNKDVSLALNFIDLLEDEVSISFGRDLSDVNKVLNDSKNYISHLLIKSKNKDERILSFTKIEKESFVVFLSDCKETSFCSTVEANKVIDTLLIKNYKQTSLAAEVKDENAI